MNNGSNLSKEEIDKNLVGELEAARKVAVSKHTTGLIVGIIVGALATMGLLFISTDSDIAFFGVMLGILIYGVISKKSKKEFIDAYKKGIVAGCFNEIFTNVKYVPESGVSEEEVISTDIIKKGDNFESEDFVSGSYKNVNFSSSDVHIQERQSDGDGHTHLVTIFRGQWYVFDFNKNFKSNVRVLEKSYPYVRRAGFFDSKETKAAYKSIELEDVDFNKKFNIYSDSELEAFYILTPPTVEKINTLNNNVQGDILLCFKDNKLHVALNSSKDNFNHSIFQPIDLDKDRAQALGEMKVIANFIDTLSLDNTLFKQR